MKRELKRKRKNTNRGDVQISWIDVRNGGEMIIQELTLPTVHEYMYYNKTTLELSKNDWAVVMSRPRSFGGFEYCQHVCSDDGYSCTPLVKGRAGHGPVNMSVRMAQTEDVTTSFTAWN